MAPASGTYDGNSFPAIGTATTPAGANVSSSGTFSYTYTDLVTGATSASAPINAGLYSVTAHFKSNDPNLTDADSLPENFDISPRPASVTPDFASKNFGDADPTLTGMLTGFLPADNVTAIYARAPGETVAGGPYIISATVSALLGNVVLSNYAITYNTEYFLINPAQVTVTASNVTGTFDGFADPYPDNQVTIGGPGGINSGGGKLTYTYDGSDDAPIYVNTYQVEVTFTPTDTADYLPATGTATLIIRPATPEVDVTVPDAVYNGQPYEAVATVTGVVPSGANASADDDPSDMLEEVKPTLIYFDGSGAELSEAPTRAGSYRVAATFAGSEDYASADSLRVPFTITAARPTVRVTDSGVYSGLPFAATATVAGVVAGADSTPAASLEGVPVTLDYQRLGANAADLGHTAPTHAGAYSVTATFAGSTDYSSAENETDFTIVQARPTLTVSDAGGMYNGSPFPATATVAGVVHGVDSNPAASLEGVSPRLDYKQLGSNGSVTADLVTASFAGSADYANATSASVPFTIGQLASARPIITSISPNSGPASNPSAGGLSVGPITVVIKGRNFTGATLVKFGSAVAQFVLNSATQITATAPAGTAGIVDITVTNSGGASATSSADKFTYVTPPAPTISPLTQAQWTAGLAGFSGTMAINGIAAPFSITAFSGLPTGLSASVNNTTHTIRFTGTPTSPGFFAGSITVQDSYGNSVTKTFSITINPPLTIKTTSLPAIAPLRTYAQTIAVSGGTGAKTFALAPGSTLPAGFRLNAATGVISGLSRALARTTTFTVVVTDAVGATTKQTLTLPA